MSVEVAPSQFRLFQQSKGARRCRQVLGKRETHLVSKPFKVVTNLDGFRANVFLGTRVPKRDF